jgi:hypothetical protein
LTSFESARRSTRQSGIWTGATGVILTCGTLFTWTDSTRHFVALAVGLTLLGSCVGGYTARRILSRAHEIDRRHG